MMVKVCGITRREDAEAAAKFGADALGFIFYPPSPRYVTPQQAAKLGEGLSPLRVGIFVNETAATIETAMRAAKLDVIQIYSGDAPHGARIWKAFRVQGPFDIRLAEGAEAVLLEGAGNGLKFDWSLAPQGQKVILAGGLNPSNVAEAIRVVRPWGVDASSGLESAPGVKDARKVQAFIEEARSVGP
jgi:phosphoribosylanthranilate isomerase